jgi:hypothetical protein
LPAVAIGPTTVPLLVTGSVPVQLSLPEPPEAVQDVALAAFQVSVIDPPGANKVGLALNVIAGGAGGAEVATVRFWLAEPVPPGPAQVRV